MKAIPTRYDGCLFRSRREARWAVFFNEAAIPWSYEDQGYDLGSAGPYLPDFRVNAGTPSDLFFEVKGIKPTQPELAKAEALCEQSALPVYVYYADVGLPAPEGLTAMDAETFFAGLYQDCERAAARDFLNRGVAPPAEITLYRTWADDYAPTAYRALRRAGRGVSVAGPIWWTDCPHCGLVVPKQWGQVGGCPQHEDVDYPQFRHATGRLSDAYAAARAERFGP